MSGVFGLDWGVVTSCAGFIEAEPETAARSFLDWQAEIFAGEDVNFVTQQVTGSIDRVLMTLDPLVSPVPTRYLFIPTASPWAAFVDNGHRGTDPVSAMSVLSKRLRCRAMRVAHVRHTLPRNVTKTSRGEWGATIWTIYPGEGTYNDCIRSVFVVNDGGKWKFGQDGEPFSFEDQSLYAAKKIRDRFTFETLERYLAHMGLHPFTPSWYLPPNSSAILIKKVGAKLPGYEERPIREAE